MIVDQASELRELVRRQRQRRQRCDRGPRLVIVCGGQPDVGATTVAVHLAEQLAARRQRIVLVDADLDGAAATGRFGVAPERTLVDVLAGTHSLPESLMPLPNGIRLLPGLWGTTLLLDCLPAAPGRLIDALVTLDEGDVAIVDVGCGRSQIVSEFWHAADQVVLVTTSGDAAVMSSYALLKLFAGRDSRAKVHVVVNRVADASQAAEVANRLISSAQRFLGVTAKLLGWLPTEAQDNADPHRLTPEGTNRPETAISRACGQWAARLFELPRAAHSAGEPPAASTRMQKGESEPTGGKPDDAGIVAVPAAPNRTKFMERETNGLNEGVLPGR